jgi:hypothetical protein
LPSSTASWSATTFSRLALDAVLAAHEASDGLGYLKPGTPTNNLEDQPAAGGTVEVADPSAPEAELDPEWSAAARLAFLRPRDRLRPGSPRRGVPAAVVPTPTG